MTGKFRSYALDAEDTLFDELRGSAVFEPVAKGRHGAVLVSPEEHRGVPIVRTTSRYDAAAHCFTDVHKRLADQIQQLASLPVEFNNALFEQYTNSYAKMGFHCDQALDLAAESHIAILSCYEHPPEASAVRKLVIQPKVDGDSFEVSLSHNSVVVFSVATNRNFTHKIVLDKSRNPPENTWLGLTFRSSSTFVRYGEGAFFEDGTPLTVANEDEQRQFFQLRGRENRERDFAYPHVSYTISESDLMAPVWPAR